MNVDPTIFPSLRCFRVEAPEFNDSDLVLQVNLDVLTADRATAINACHLGAVERLAASAGNAQHAVIKLFAEHLFQDLLATGGVLIKAHDAEAAAYWTQRIHDSAGWSGPEAESQAFGWCGIRLVQADVPGPAFEDLNLVELDS